MKMTVLCCTHNGNIGSSRKVARKRRGGEGDGHRRESVEKNTHDNEL